ncbi:MAG: exopolyphosphatase, partial [Actinomycetota bacterium]
TRLGERVDASRRLQPDAIERTIGAIAGFCAIAGELGAQRLRLAGTSALRDAANREEFIEAASRVIGGDPEILSGAREAELSFAGATRDLGAGRYLITDIGGGSTELVAGHPGGAQGAGAVEEAVSLDIGSVRLTERHLRSDPPSDQELGVLETNIDQALEEVEMKIHRTSPTRLVGVAGTVTSLAAMRLGLEAHDPVRTHGLTLEREELTRLYRGLAHMTTQQRRKIPALPSGRADVIVAGASILVRIMARWSFSEIICSEKDILDGLVLEMARAG